jgi:transposase
MWRAFLSELNHEGILDWDEVFGDGSFFAAKKALQLERPSGEREQSAWYWSMARVFLSEAVPILPAAGPRRLRSRSGIRALGEIRVPKRGPGSPRTRRKRPITDKAYDSDPTRKRLKKRGISLQAPHRRNHPNVNRQDDRLWDHCRRRNIVERTCGWITNFQRIVVRYDNHVNMFVAFSQLACLMTTLKKCLELVAKPTFVAVTR